MKNWIPIYSPIMFAYQNVFNNKSIGEITKYEFLNGFYHGFTLGIIWYLIAIIVFEICSIFYI